MHQLIKVLPSNLTHVSMTSFLARCSSSDKVTLWLNSSMFACNGEYLMGRCGGGMAPAVVGAVLSAAAAVSMRHPLLLLPLMPPLHVTGLLVVALVLADAWLAPRAQLL